jgi:hypothetical protein
MKNLSDVRTAGSLPLAYQAEHVSQGDLACRHGARPFFHAEADDSSKST